MKRPLSELPGQKTVLTVATLFLRIRAALCRSQNRAPSPADTEAFSFAACDFIIHSRLRELREACLPPPDTMAGKGEKGARSRPWPRLGERIRWERTSCPSRVLIVTLVMCSLGRAQNCPLCAGTSRQGLVSLPTAPGRPTGNRGLSGAR